MGEAILVAFTVLRTEHHAAPAVERVPAHVNCRDSRGSGNGESVRVGGDQPPDAVALAGAAGAGETDIVTGGNQPLEARFRCAHKSGGEWRMGRRSLRDGIVALEPDP